MGKPFFITEKETEELLELETRRIPMPDGAMRPFTDTKLLWETYDFLIFCGKWSAKELARLAVVNSEETGCTFEASFPSVLTYLDQDARKKMGID